MNISVFGLGYVGVVSAACLANDGHQVLGVDISEDKVDSINRGVSPIVEEGIGEMLAEQVQSGRLRACLSAQEAMRETDISLISVGTPSEANGALSLTAIDQISKELGTLLAEKDSEHLIVLRSTLLPGTTQERVIPLLEQYSGKSLGDGFQVCYNPEFLREGSSIRDFYSPAMTVVGSDSDAAIAQVRELYAKIDGKFIPTSIRQAESVKYLSNIYHAVKISFANECGAVLREAGVDARAAMEIFMEDDRLNVSKAYLRPGNAFGGSCLPKDVRAFLHYARSRDINIPMLANVLPGNEAHLDRVWQLITEHPGRNIALLGLAFKNGTDDLRESPMVTVAERLIGRGYQLRIYDPYISTAMLIGANKRYIEKEIPHFEQLLHSDLDGVLTGADIVVLANAESDAVQQLLDNGLNCPVVDLQGSRAVADQWQGAYSGICW